MNCTHVYKVKSLFILCVKSMASNKHGTRVNTKIPESRQSGPLHRMGLSLSIPAVVCWWAQNQRNCSRSFPLQMWIRYEYLFSQITLDGRCVSRCARPWPLDTQQVAQTSKVLAASEATSRSFASFDQAVSRRL